MLQRDDDGFSLVELVLAMLLLAVISLAVLPLLIGVSGLSVGNRDELAATTFAKGQLAKLQAEYSSNPGVATTSCETLSMLNGAPAMSDASGRFKSSVRVSACPASYPATVSVSVMVSKAGHEVTRVSTRLRVGVR